MRKDVLQRNNVVVSGRGVQPMLFAHGFGCDQQMWRLVAPAFEDDYRVVRFDYVGSGKSDATAYDAGRYSALDGYADDVLEICNALDLRDVIFVGHSVSAMIGVLAASREPERFSRLILIGPSPRYINEGAYTGGFERADLEGLLDVMERNVMGWGGFLAPMVMKNPERPELTAELEAAFCAGDPEITRRFAQVTFFSDNREDLARVKVPALVMQCADDAIAPPEVGKYVAERLEGSTFRQLGATGHCPHLSHPEETVAVIREYLRTPPAA